MKDYRQLKKIALNLGKSYIFESGVLITVEETGGKTTEQIQELHDKRLADGDLWDYQEACNGYLARPKIQTHKHRHANIAIRIASLFIASIAACASTYYTTVFMARDTIIWLAVGLSLSMVLFTSFGLAVAILIAKEGYWYLSVLIVPLWLVIMLYSMSTTVLVKTDDYRAMQGANITSSVTETDYTKQQYEMKMKDMEKLQINIANYDGDDVWATINMQKKAEVLRSEIDILYTQLLEKSVTVVKEQSIYDLVGQVIGIEANKLQFIINLLPALFIDIIAAICVSVSALLGQTRGK